MRAAFGILALCLVASAAVAIQSPEQRVRDLIDEVKAITAAAAEDLKRQLEDLVNQEIQEVQDILRRIEELKDESVACVDAEVSRIESTLEAAESNISNCYSEAVRTSVQIMTDMEKAVQQLIFDGIDVVQTYRRCQKMPDGLRKRICEANLDAKALLYTWQARRSIRTIKGVRQTVPAVGVDGVSCVKRVGNETVDQLNAAVRNIESCIPV